MDHKVLATGLQFPEGPAFARDGSIWGVELMGRCVFRWTADGIERFAAGGSPNGLAVHDDEAWFCDADDGSIRRLTGARLIETVLSSEPAAMFHRPNDLAFDAAGNLVFTCPGNSRQIPTGSVWGRSPDGQISRVADAMLFPNGLAFSPAGDELVVAETYAHRLWRGGWDGAALSWVNPRPWLDVGGPIGPDGMAFAADGSLYVAIFGQGRIAVVDPEGRIAATIATPGSRPTNVAIDPSGGYGLIVTEAERGELISYPNVDCRDAVFRYRAAEK